MLDLSKNVLILSVSLLTIPSFIPIHTFFLQVDNFLYFWRIVIEMAFLFPFINMKGVII